MEPGQDAKSLVFNGSAGTAQSGAAFVLKDAWRYPLDLQAREDAQNQRLAAQQAHYAQQNKLALDKEANKQVAELAKFDPAGVLPEDATRFVEQHNASLAQTQADIARGRHPGNSSNAAEWRSLQQRTGALAADLEQSRQYNAERVKQMQIVQGAGVDKPYDVPALTAQWNAFVNASPEERTKMGTPKLSQAILPEKVAQYLMGDVEQAVTEDKPVLTGSGVLTHSVTQFTPEQIAAGAKGILAYPGMSDFFEQEYQNPDNAAKVKATGALNFNQYAQARARELAAQVKAPKEKYDQTWSREPRPAAENQKYQQERRDEETAVTTILRDVASLQQGNRNLFVNAVPGHPELLGTTHFLGKDLGVAQITKTDGTKQDVKNQVKGFAYNPETEKLYMKTTATEAAGKDWVEVTKGMLLNDIIDPLYKSGGGKGDVAQRLSKGYLIPGTAELDLTPLGSAASAEDRAAQRAVVARSKANLEKVHRDTEYNVNHIRVGGNVTDAAVNNEAVGKVNGVLAGANLYYKGDWLPSPTVVFRRGGEKPGLFLKYAKTDPKTKNVTHPEVPVTREELARLVSNPKTLRVNGRYLRSVDSTDQPVAPGTAPTADATTAVTRQSSNGGSGSVQRFRPGAPTPAPAPKYRFIPGQK